MTTSGRSECTRRARPTGRGTKLGAGALLLMGIFAGMIGVAPSAFAHHAYVHGAPVGAWVQGVTVTPATPTTITPADAPATLTPAGSLARSGAATAGLLGVAMTLFTAGTVLLAVRRRLAAVQQE